jgi:hypothetical protein
MSRGAERSARTAAWSRQFLLTTALTMGLLVGVLAAPASAHTTGPGPTAMNYRTSLSSVWPRLAGISVRVVDGGLHLELTNTSAEPVTVLGYAAEPYLKVTRAGVWENGRSPAAYLNASFTPGKVPASADPAAVPAWRKISAGNTARWHDHRIHWMGTSPPPAAQRSPGTYHLIGRWQVFAQQHGTPITIAGTLAWVPGPSPWPWLALAAALAALLTAALWLLARRWRPLTAASLTGLLAIGVTAAAGLVAGRSGGLWTRLDALPGHGWLNLLVWIGTLVTLPYVLRGRLGGLYTAASIGVTAVIVSGLATVSTLYHSQYVTALPPEFGRTLTALILGAGAGLFAGGLLALHRLDPLPSARGRHGADADPATGAQT